MKYKKILLFFLFALPLSVGLRLAQLFFIVDTETGFFKPEFGAYGGYMLAVIFAFGILAAVFAFTSHRSPEHPPKPNIAMSISALGFAVALFYEINNEVLPATVQNWQRSLLFIMAIITGVYLVTFAVRRFINFALPAACAVIPTVYLVIRVICYFSAISPLALISDNIILMAAYLVSLVFMLNFAKLYNGVDSEYNFRKLLASGLSASILCFTQSVPHFIINFATDFKYQHTSMESNITVFFMGIFILSFIFSHFSHKNACE